MKREHSRNMSTSMNITSSAIISNSTSSSSKKLTSSNNASHSISVKEKRSESRTTQLNGFQQEGSQSISLTATSSTVKQSNNEVAKPAINRGTINEYNPIGEVIPSEKPVPAVVSFPPNLLPHGTSKSQLHESLLSKDMTLNELKHPSKWESLLVLQDVQRQRTPSIISTID